MSSVVSLGEAIAKSINEELDRKAAGNGGSVDTEKLVKAYGLKDKN